MRAKRRKRRLRRRSIETRQNLACWKARKAWKNKDKRERRAELIYK